MYICVLCNPLNVTSWHSVSQLFPVMKNHPGWTFSVTVCPHSKSPLLYSRLLNVLLCFTVPTFPQPVLPQTVFCSNLLHDYMLSSWSVRLSIRLSICLSCLSLAYFSIKTSIFLSVTKDRNFFLLVEQMVFFWAHIPYSIPSLMSSGSRHIWVAVNTAVANTGCRRCLCRILALGCLEDHILISWGPCVQFDYSACTIPVPTITVQSSFSLCPLRIGYLLCFS